MMALERLALSIKKAARDYTCNKCHKDIPKGSFYVLAEVKRYTDWTNKVYASTRYPEHRTCPIADEEVVAIFDKAVADAGGYLEDFNVNATVDAIAELIKKRSGT
jgi:hypothetical protein